MRSLKAVRLAAAALGLILAATGCGVTGSGGSNPQGSASGASSEPLKGLRIMVPNSPGGGYDTTARTAAKVMGETKTATNVEVFNLAGAGGTVGLARLVNEKGNKDLTMLMGLGVVGASYTNKSPAKLTETVPLARLIQEPGAIMVPKSSPYKTIKDLVDAWKADPSKLAVGGGSNPGGPDHLLPMQLAQA
ncbi:MAG: tripartite tricarboxylate transporter substrate binding protein, partial [Arthrobacter sp.]|nr:tripartite tricarboxylate transporter substrate binding protein [Arthrobacter sp.]